MNIRKLVYVSLLAVGIQMKLEFFQRKFWTASKQVHTHQTPTSTKTCVKTMAVVLLLEFTVVTGETWGYFFFFHLYSAQRWMGNAP